MPVKFYRAKRSVFRYAPLDDYAHLQNPKVPSMTRCGQRLDIAASVKGKELCDLCLDAAGREG